MCGFQFMLAKKYFKYYVNFNKCEAIKFSNRAASFRTSVQSNMYNLESFFKEFLPVSKNISVYFCLQAKKQDWFRGKQYY